MDLFLLNNIPIKPLCNIIQEYCNYPRPYLKEISDATSKIKATIDYCRGDLGCTGLLIFKRMGRFKFGYTSSFTKTNNKFLLLERENKRRVSFGLKINSGFFNDPYTATNECYLCF